MKQFSVMQRVQNYISQNCEPKDDFPAFLSFENMLYLFMKCGDFTRAEERRDMIRIAICDDNTRDRILLADLCRRFFGKKNDYTINSYSSATDYISSFCRPDILFLDVEMDNMSGLQLKDLLGEQESCPRILFVSNHPESIAEAFGRHVYGFLTKPINSRLFNQKMQKLFQDIQKMRHEKTFFTEGTLKKVSFYMDAILYIEAQDKYVNIYLDDGTMVFDGRSIKEWQKILKQEHFAMSHRSYLVNLTKIRIENQKFILENGTPAPISRRMQKQFQETYDAFLIETSTYGGK